MPEVIPLPTVFIDHVAPALKAPAQSWAALAPTLENFVGTATLAWPTLDVPPSVFIAHLAEKVPEGREIAESLDEISASDLYIACACAQGFKVAIEAFETRYFREIGFALNRAYYPNVLADDLRQVLREKLFVARADRRPQIAEYAGRGSLLGWFRVVVARTLINAAMRGPKLLQRDDFGLLELPYSAEGVEMAHLRRLYSHELSEAFPQAMATLSLRERTLLRQHYLDDVTLDQLSALHGVHRATTKRQLAKARERLLLSLREILQGRLKLSPSEFDSIIRIVRSKFELTLRDLLMTPRLPG